MQDSDQRRLAAAASRNRLPILEVLRGWLADDAEVLEIASGTGEHAVYLCQNRPRMYWQASDADGDALASIAAWRESEGLQNMLPPLFLDVETAPWSTLGRYDAIFNANMIHIAPWSTCEALMRAAQAHLRQCGALIMYGPYRVAGEHTSASNVAFDASLRQRDLRWGVRDLEAVCELALAHGLSLRERVSMPANNFMLRFEFEPNRSVSGVA